MVRGNKYKCYYCGQEEKCTSDHFYPKSREGRLKVYACKLCQRTKANMLPGEYMDYINNHVAIDKDVKIRITRAIKSLLKLTNDPDVPEHLRLLYPTNKNKN
jgi:hypothetical protein